MYDDPSGHSISGKSSSPLSGMVLSGGSAKASVKEYSNSNNSYISNKAQDANDKSYTIDCDTYYEESLEWYDYLTSGLIGFGMGFALDTTAGFAMPFLSITDLIFGTNNASAFMQMQTQSEYNVKSQYVKDDTWYYGGKILGHAASFIFGMYQAASGLKLMAESIMFVAGGIAATVTGVGAPVGGTAIAIAGSVAIAGAATVAAGAGTMYYSAQNMSSDIDNFIDSPNNNKNSNNYYKKGLKDIPDDWIEVEEPEEYPVKSDSFKEFLKSQGENPKKWKKVVEKWASPDGTIYQRHYWTNGKDYYYHGEGIEEFYPH